MSTPAVNFGRQCRKGFTMKSLLLTEHEEQALRMFLLMTTNYRRGEQESCASLASEVNQDGTLTFPKMAANARWWKGCIDTIDAVTENMGVRGGGLPLEVAEAALYAYYKNMQDDGTAGMSRKMIEHERTFYDGMLQMLKLLGGRCRISEYGFHNIDFIDAKPQKTATDPAHS